MIKTQYGIEIERVTKLNLSEGWADLILKGDTAERSFSIAKLKADGGLDEIIKAAELFKNY